MFLAAAELHLADFGDAVHNVRCFFAEKPFYFRELRHRIFDGVMEQTGDDADHIHFHLGQDMSDLKGMGEIGFAG